MVSCVPIIGYKVADTWSFRQGWPHGAGGWIEVANNQVLRSVMALKGSASPCEPTVLRQYGGSSPRAFTGPCVNVELRGGAGHGY